MLDLQSVEDAEFVRETERRAWRPDPIETIAEWSDTHMELPSWSAEPGKWRTSRTPYLKEIMECLSPLHPARRVVFMKCAQIGGTSCGQNWIGYTIHRAPRAMLIVEPTVDVSKKLSKQRIQPMLDSVPALKGKVKEARSRDAGNTILGKEFQGGMMVLTGANSGVGLRFMAAQNLFLDEVDAYPYDVDGEGTPVALAEKRTLTYARHKIYLCSTPLLKPTSVIEPEYESSDQRRYYVHCPFCSHAQYLIWANLKWPTYTPDETQAKCPHCALRSRHSHPERAMYACESCHRLIPEHHKTRMLEEGRWVAKFPERETVGFHLNALYAPYGWVNSWAYLAKEWVRIIHKKDFLAQQTFTNTNLAETWEEKGVKMDHDALYKRRETYPAPCPMGVIVLTGSVDVQDNRLEVECVGWGMDEESWSIDYRVFLGSPGQPDVWKEVDQWRKTLWPHENGMNLTIVQLAVDTGGHHTKEAYEWIKEREPERVVATKGSSQPGHPLVGRPTTSNFGGVQLYSVGTDSAKDTLFSRLGLTTFGPGYCHHPDTLAYDEVYFDQLSSEEKFNKYDKGVLLGTYYKKVKSRNEALDLKILNMAAYAILNPNMAALAATMYAKVQKPEPPPPSPPPPEPLNAPPAVVKHGNVLPRRRGRGFASRW